MSGIDDLLRQYSTYLFLLFAVLLAFIHWKSRMPSGFQYFFLPVLLCLSVLVFVILAARPQPEPFGRLAALIVTYGVGLFTFLDSLMVAGLAKKLTAWRGEKWVKEMDYVYLALGSGGILLSLNKVEFLTGRFETADILAPLLLASAVVFRALKTRVEIAEWNKLPTFSAPAASAASSAPPSS
jgi:hypothetical protein